MTPWPESANKLYQPRDPRLSANLVPTFADRECHVVSVMDPYGRILGFLDRSHYFFFQVAPQLYSRG
jgi:CBS-domain-containing membrane protein